VLTIYSTITDTANNPGMMNETTAEKSRTTFDTNENQHTLTTDYSDQGMSHNMEERMYEVSEEAE
jgi:hypothetical protein